MLCAKSAYQGIPFLKQYNPTSIYCRPSHPKRPVGRPNSKRLSQDKGVKGQGICRKKSEKKKTGIYKSYSYAQKLKVVQYAKRNTEAEASKRYNVPRSTIYYWKDIDKVPAEKF